MQDCVTFAGSPIGRKPREPVSPPPVGVFCTQRVCLQSLNVILALGPSFSVLEVGMHATSPVLHASSPSSSLIRDARLFQPAACLPWFKKKTAAAATPKPCPG